jgi:hypothetical protein
MSGNLESAVRELIAAAQDLDPFNERGDSDDTGVSSQERSERRLREAIQAVEGILAEKDRV